MATHSPHPHLLLRSTLALSQFCALFPVRGVVQSDSSKLRWCPLLVVYWLVTWAGLTFGLYRSHTVTNFRNPNGSLSAISNFTLLRAAGPPLVIYPIFLRLSYRWPRFIHMWEKIQEEMTLNTPSRVLARKINIYTLIFAALSCCLDIEVGMATHSPHPHLLLRSTLALSQFCALFPVRGVVQSDSSKLRWCPLLVVYWLVTWAGLTFGLYRSYTVTNFRNPNGSLSAISNFTLLRAAGPPLVIYPLFLRLSYSWPRFIHMWEKIQEEMTLNTPSRVLARKINIYTLIFAALRCYFFIGGYVVAGVRLVQCEGVTTFRGFLHMLFQVRFPHIFSITPPTFWKYVTCAFLELTSTGSWLCAELMILHISLIILEQFRGYNNHLKQSNNKVSPQFWHVMRKEYVWLAVMVNKADSLLGPFIFTIVILETMLVILFIYLVLTHSYTLLSYGYFLIFFMSHIGIDVITLLAMASVFDESKKSLVVLHNLPSNLFCQEVRRLYTHVKKDTVALTGCKFFVVTQTAILSIISALVTYEVLLVQLGNLKHDPDNSDPTDSVFCSWIEIYLSIK